MSVKSDAPVEAIRVILRPSAIIAVILFPVMAWMQLHDADDWNDWVLGGGALVFSIFNFLAVLGGRVWQVSCLIGEKWHHTHENITRQHASAAKNSLMEQFPTAVLYYLPFQPVPIFVAISITAAFLFVEIV